MLSCRVCAPVSTPAKSTPMPASAERDGDGGTLRTHLVAAGDPVAQLIDEVLTVLAGQLVENLLAHQLLCSLDDFAGRQWQYLPSCLLLT